MWNLVTLAFTYRIKYLERKQSKFLNVAAFILKIDYPPHGYLPVILILYVMS